MTTRNPLSALLYNKRISQLEFSEMLGRSLWYVSFRLTGKEPWNTDEVHKIVKMFDIPASEALTYFPPTGGKS